jgi:hypothetical protein
MQSVPFELLLATILAMPGPQVGQTVQNQPVQPQNANSAPDQLSPSFSRAAMSSLAQIYRWKERTRNDAKATVPSPVLHDYLKTGAYESVRQAQLSSSTDGDKRAGEALLSAYSQVDAWSSKLAESRKNLDATNRVNPDAVDKDEDLLKINDCVKGLNAMLGSGTYTDVPSCH